MSLYIRLETSFWKHRKLVRLRTLIGADAMWIPQRLWCYAAENQPDGVFNDYTADEIAMLIGYEGDPQSMLQAMLQAGFMDENPLRIHDWDEYNGYHRVFSERAAKAAKVRWQRKSPPIPPLRKVQDSTVHDTSIAASNASSIRDMACVIYQAYPRHVAKTPAIKAIERALKEVPYETLIEATKGYAKQRAGEDPKFTPHPSTWFNQKRWEDVGQPETPAAPKGPRPFEQLLISLDATIEEIRVMTPEQNSQYTRVYNA